MNDIIIFLQHHFMLFGGLVFVFFAVIILEVIEASRSAFRLTPQKVVEYMNHKKAVLVDIRNSEAFKKGHIIHAINISDDDFKTKVTKLKQHQNDILILIDSDGERAVVFARQLIKAGFLQTHVLTGGVKAWVAAGLPLEK